MLKHTGLKSLERALARWDPVAPCSYRAINEWITNITVRNANVDQLTVDSNDNEQRV